MLPIGLLANMIYCWKFGNLPTIEDWHLDAVLVVLLPTVWFGLQKNTKATIIGSPHPYWVQERFKISNFMY